MTIATLNQIFDITCSIDRPAVCKFKRGGRWVDTTVAEFRDNVRWLAIFLRHAGVKAGDRVAILSENRPEWAMADFAALADQAVTVPVYPTLLGWQVEYILNDAGACVVICSDDEQLKKLGEVRGHCPAVHTVIVCDGPATLPAGVVTFAQAVDAGRRNDDAAERARFDELRNGAKPDHLATLVYTSGTTGNPKGAMLTHGNVASNVDAALGQLPIHAQPTTLSILPLSHIFERMIDYAMFARGATIAYAESVTKVGENLQEIRPQIFAAVPRLFEKMRARILDNVAAQSAGKQKIFAWALKVGQERLPYRIGGKAMPPTLAVKSALADALVFKKIKARLGGRVEFVLSGGAPLSAELAAFFIGAGIDILEGYGLTETSPIITANLPHKRKIGSVGTLLPGLELRIAPDGEILTRGPHVMKGYWNNPEATAQAIDAEGWFHTGDIGDVDADGFLKITDRKKDIIINAYGKNIAPQPLEALLKSSPYVGTPVLIGDRRKYLAALIVPNFEKLERDTASLGMKFDTRDALCADERVRRIYQDEIDRFNANLDRQEKIRRFALLARDFTIEADEITPSLKVKRKVIDKKYKDVIDQLYVDEGVEEREAQPA